MAEVASTFAKDNFAPHWSVVPFAVACARCGHDLHGRSEPTCPGCALTFRWADAVPIEQLTCTACGYHLYGLKEPRCPECATTFTWDEALANYHRQRKPLFEYQWRTKPVRSLFYTWWLALRPKKLWTTVDIHDPVRWKALLGLIVASYVLFLGAFIFVMASAQFASFAIQYYQAPVSQRILTGEQIWTYTGGWTLTVLFSPGGRGTLWAISAVMLIWLSSATVGLSVFQQSMSRLRIRQAHLLRIAAYTMLLPCMFCACYGGLYTGLTFVIMWVPRRSLPFPWFAVVLLIFYSTYSVAMAYRYYLRMKHAWSVAVAAHFIAVLLALVLSIFVLPSGIGFEFFKSIARNLGLL